MALVVIDTEWLLIYIDAWSLNSAMHGTIEGRYELYTLVLENLNFMSITITFSVWCWYFRPSVSNRYRLNLSPRSIFINDCLCA